MYKTATPDLTAEEGIDLILDAAVATAPNLESNYGHGWREGVGTALASLLSDSERPADLILDEALAGTQQAAEARLPEPRDWVVSVTEYGGHEVSTSVFGPYSKDEALEKLRELAGDAGAGANGAFGGFDYSDEGTQISVTQLYR